MARCYSVFAPPDYYPSAQMGGTVNGELCLFISTVDLSEQLCCLLN
jgi:hypothetical protein